MSASTPRQRVPNRRRNPGVADTSARHDAQDVVAGSNDQVVGSQQVEVATAHPGYDAVKMVTDVDLADGASGEVRIGDHEAAEVDIAAILGQGRRTG